MPSIFEEHGINGPIAWWQSEWKLSVNCTIQWLVHIMWFPWRGSSKSSFSFFPGWRCDNLSGSHLKPKVVWWSIVISIARWSQLFCLSKVPLILVKSRVVATFTLSIASQIRSYSSRFALWFYSCHEKVIGAIISGNLRWYTSFLKVIVKRP